MNIKYYFFLLVILGCSTPKKIVKNENNQKAFEGSVTYKLSMVRPDMIPEEEWKIRQKEISGEQGYFEFKNYYRPNQFASDVNSGLSIGKQVYNPIDSLHYGWELDSDTAATEDNFGESIIKIKDIVDLDTTAIINNIPCKAIKVNLTFGHTIVWYNSSLFDFKGDDYRGSLFGKEIIDRINTLPVKAEMSGMMIVEMLDFERTSVDDSHFVIPKFKTIQKKPSF
ncbi:MAG: hypothetical protein AB8G22_25400 [Saprospiraceae bacterium]